MGSASATTSRPAPTPPVPTPSPSPPAAAGTAQCCVYGGCASYGTPYCIAAGLWCSLSDEACSTCGGTLCTEVALLSGGPVQARKFLHRPGHGGHVLLQTQQVSRKVQEKEWL